TKAYLGQPGYDDAVDKNAAGLQKEEDEQQMNEGRFAGARAANEADPLARRDVDIEAAQHAAAPRRAAVIEADALETDPSGDRRQFGCLWQIGHLPRLRDRAHAVLHLADIVENAGDLLRHPAGYVGDLPSH